jgi:hypothetical protein
MLSSMNLRVKSYEESKIKMNDKSVSASNVEFEIEMCANLNVESNDEHEIKTNEDFKFESSKILNN